MRADRGPLALLGIALGLGFLADLMLRTSPAGLNAAVVTVALTLAIAATRSAPGGTPRLPLAVAAVAIGLAFCWRDSPVLKGLDLLAAVVVLGLLASPRRQGPSLSGHAWSVGRTSAYTAAGPIPALAEVSWADVPRPISTGVMTALLRGLLLAAPIVTVFAVLLASADAVFAVELRGLLNVDLSDVVGHTVLTLTFAWLAAGALWAGFCPPRVAPRPERPGWLSLGAIEIGLVLGLLDLLFGGFVWVQMRYLFGGDAWVSTVAGLTYSQYARRGFFELVAVTALALPLLLLAHWLLGPARAAVRRAVHGLAAVQVVLVLVMLASALERMNVYRAQYGQTELRFYTTAFMLWLGVLLVSFLLTVLPGRRAVFAQVTLATAFAALALLHAANPDARIVRANRHAPTGFDLEYALSLSADAVPALLEAAPSLPPAEQGALAARLRARWSGPEPDLRSWSLARDRARRLVGAPPGVSKNARGPLSSRDDGFARSKEARR